MFKQAVEVVIDAGQASTSLLQRRCCPFCRPEWRAFPWLRSWLRHTARCRSA
ncbi:hypothetical protein ACSTB0_13700 [Faecalibacterium wellingii]|uniref:hypothetical protein n=1 Tax=Faecalibacterium wellingii TaxID=2929491 RepID=UPI003EDACBCF